MWDPSEPASATINASPLTSRMICGRRITGCDRSATGSVWAVPRIRPPLTQEGATGAFAAGGGAATDDATGMGSGIGMIHDSLSDGVGCATPNTDVRRDPEPPTVAVESENDRALGVVDMRPPTLML